MEILHCRMTGFGEETESLLCDYSALFSCTLTIQHKPSLSTSSFYSHLFHSLIAKMALKPFFFFLLFMPVGKAVYPCVSFIFLKFDNMLF